MIGRQGASMGRQRLFTAYLSGNRLVTGDCIREEWVFIRNVFVWKVKYLLDFIFIIISIVYDLILVRDHFFEK